MNNGGKRYFNAIKSGNWFSPSGASPDGQTWDFQTSSASALAQAVSHSLPQAERRYPKRCTGLAKKKAEQEYPLSAHDNRTALQNCIDIYDKGAGRKKCLDEFRQHNSHYSLNHHPYNPLGPLSPREWDQSVYQTDFLSRQEPDSRGQPIRRRFPRDHSARAQMNSAAQPGERFMWFGRDDSQQNTPLSVLAGANLTLTP